MKWTQFVIIFAVIACSHGQDFGSWCPKLADDMTACINDHLSSLKTLGSMFTNPSQVMNVQSVVSSALNTVCQPSALAAVEGFYGCIFDKLLGCIPEEWKKAFPDADKAKEVLKFMCDNRDDLDLGCAADSARATNLINCMGVGTSGAPDVSTPEAFLKYQCSNSEKYIPCIDTAYGNCPKKTAEVMKKSIKYQEPVGCDACISKPSLVLLMSFLILFFVNKHMV